MIDNEREFLFLSISRISADDAAEMSANANSMENIWYI